MKNTVMIKGNKSGIVLVLDKEIDFKSLKQHVADKFSESKKFLGDACMALTFEGRKLSSEEQRQILDVISEYSDLKIMCIVDQDEQKEKIFKQSLEEKLMQTDGNTGQFYKGNLRSGQVAEFETSVIIIGDVNSGAKVVSKGNIIILGTLKGNACAGVSGNENAFVLALDMQPIQIRIADLIARSPDENKLIRRNKKEKAEIKIAFVEDGNIYIEPLSKDVLNDIIL